MAVFYFMTHNYWYDAGAWKDSKLDQPWFVIHYASDLLHTRFVSRQCLLHLYFKLLSFHTLVHELLSAFEGIWGLDEP